MFIPQAFALDLQPVECKFGLFCPQGGDVVAPTESLISTILGFLTIVAGLAFLIYFMIGAINWITGGDDKGKVDTAKKYMTNGAIGMIAIAASYAIVAIVGNVLGFKFLDLGDVINKITPSGQSPGTTNTNSPNVANPRTNTQAN